jgi:predicted dehydrogenase
LVEQALQAGKSVLSEKPMAYSSAQGRRLLAAQAAGQVYAVGYMKRFDPGVRLFRDMLAAARTDGAMGDIVHVEIADFCPTYGVSIPSHIRTDEEKSYRFDEWPAAPDGLPAENRADFEFMLNVGSHDLNLARWLLGSELVPQALFARAGRSQTAVMSAPACDVLMTIGKSDTGRWNQSIKFFFSRGQMELKLPSPLARQETATIEIRKPGYTGTIEIPPAEKIWAFQAQASHFTAAVAGDVSLETSGSDSLNDIALIEALWAKVIWRQ